LRELAASHPLPSHCQRRPGGVRRRGNPDVVVATGSPPFPEGSSAVGEGGQRLWNVELQQLADETGWVIEVCHDPPGTSTWNKIEHRLLCHITRNWAGEPLETADLVVEWIARTKTETALEVHAWLDESQHLKGRKVSDAELCECRIRRHRFHGEWNDEIHPRISHQMEKLI
jgi:hypothetical protein